MAELLDGWPTERERVRQEASPFRAPYPGAPLIEWVADVTTTVEVLARFGCSCGWRGHAWHEEGTPAPPAPEACPSCGKAFRG